MPRQDVPYGGAICRLRERIAEIFDKLGEKLHTINGVPGDGDGNVKIVSGSSAVVINNDPTQNEIAVSLDTSQLPAASVSSVNGQTGAVALTADDIPSDNGDVQTDLDNLEAADTTLQGNINAEALARGNADSTLQTNINAVAADIAPFTGTTGSDLKPIKIVNGSPFAVTNDLVDTASAQTVGGAKTFSAQMLATGQRAYAPGNTTDVATIATLDAYTPMVRTTDYQVIIGAKVFDGMPGACNARNSNIDPDNPPTNETIVGEWQALGLNNAVIGQILVVATPQGGTYMNAILRNADGTYKAVRLATSD